MPDVLALIFDCDGTLTDSMPLHYLAWREVLGRHGIGFDEDRFYALGGMPTDKIIAMLAGEHGLQLDALAVAHEKEQAFIDGIHLLEEIPAITGIVRRERGRLKMAVASGGFRNVVFSQLQQLGLADFFDAVVAAEDTERHKPEPDVFLEAARRLGVPPERCRVYEDSDLGIEAARRAGMEWFDVRTIHRPKRITPAKQVN
jgi:beta-phosphoglucomutase-like phosphatase (HAD superfamily)